ncbi:hypothetical protein [Streptomyces odontomachi]|uniref:hypothetical protein n=1 Tax=Streptomyces odontomachi TaxID=2944940 RepID=UPI00210D4348|nr:hypothetical protein [Streptomyces sp. ODS25]
MAKATTKRTAWFVLWAVVAAIFALANVRVFVPGASDDYRPRCDHQWMQPGDACIGSGGGSYDEMVHDHERNQELLFLISCPLTFVFTGLAIGERRRARRMKRRVGKAS